MTYEEIVNELLIQNRVNKDTRCGCFVSEKEDNKWQAEIIFEDNNGKIITVQFLDDYQIDAHFKREEMYKRVLHEVFNLGLLLTKQSLEKINPFK